MYSERKKHQTTIKKNNNQITSNNIKQQQHSTILNNPQGSTLDFLMIPKSYWIHLQPTLQVHLLSYTRGCSAAHCQGEDFFPSRKFRAFDGVMPCLQFEDLFQVSWCLKIFKNLEKQSATLIETWAKQKKHAGKWCVSFFGGVFPPVKAHTFGIQVPMSSFQVRPQSLTLQVSPTVVGNFQDPFQDLEANMFHPCCFPQRGVESTNRFVDERSMLHV